MTPSSRRLRAIPEREAGENELRRVKESRLGCCVELAKSSTVRQKWKWIAEQTWRQGTDIINIQGIKKSSEIWIKIKSNHLTKIWFKIKSNRFTKWQIILSTLINLYYNPKNIKNFFGILLVFMLFIKCFVAMWKHDFKWFEIWFSWTFRKSNLKSNPHISIWFQKSQICPKMT
jgi:hypothetical protein